MMSTLKHLVAATATIVLLTAVARAQFSPIPLDPSSYNQDMVIEAGAPAVPGG